MVKIVLYYSIRKVTSFYCANNKITVYSNCPIEISYVTDHCIPSVCHVLSLIYFVLLSLESFIIVLDYRTDTTFSRFEF